MIKHFLKAFKILNSNIILTTPLVLFILILSVYGAIVFNNLSNVYVLAFLLTTVLFMCAAFFAGWYNMIKKAIKIDETVFDSEDEKSKASFGLLKEFTAGIGEYFLSYVGQILFYVAVFSLLALSGFYLGMHFIGKVDIDVHRLKIALNSPVALKAFIASIPVPELIKISKWYLEYLSFLLFFYFITMFWGAEIIFKTKNPFKALFKSISFIFRNFLTSLILFIYVIVLNVIISRLTVLSAANQILYFFMTLVSFYFLVYYVVLIFLYYDKQNKPKAKNNSDCGTDCSGENSICNTESIDE